MRSLLQRTADLQSLLKDRDLINKFKKTIYLLHALVYKQLKEQGGEQYGGY